MIFERSNLENVPISFIIGHPEGDATVAFCLDSRKRAGVFRGFGTPADDRIQHAQAFFAQCLAMALRNIDA